MQDTITQFVDRLVQEKAFTNLSAEVLAQIKEDLKARVEDKINIAILGALPPDKLAEFESLLDQKSDARKIQSFCRGQIANLDEVLAAALLEFRSTYLNV